MSGAARRLMSPDEVLALARTLQGRGELPQAEGAYRNVLRHRADDLTALAGLAEVRLGLGDPDGAAELCNDRGVLLAGLDRHEEAVAAFSAACNLRPDFARAYSNLGNSLMALHRVVDAVASFRVALARDPGDAVAEANMASALLELNHADDALPHLDRALTLDPGLADAHNARGHALVTLGDLRGAEAAYAAAVALRPDRGDFYHGLAATRLLGGDDPDFMAMQALARTLGGGPVRGRAGLHFALHRAYEHQGRYAEAFAELLAGNAMRRATMPYDEAATLGHMADIEAAFDADLLRRAPPRTGRPPGTGMGVPIFILGMPRSGSTLVEQILSSHRDVFGAGEMPYLGDEASRLGTDGARYPAGVGALPPGRFRELGEAYRTRLRALAPDAPGITDKMPSNFLHLGLIRLALPGARVIHTRRDPMDTCLSCFVQTFNKGIGYANDLGETGRYYRAYARLMAHWRRVLEDGFVLDVQYEDLVTDLEPQVRRILGFCGLPWDPACLAPHENQRPVLTASAAQVRRPVYRSSAGRARRYGALLAPLAEAIGVS